VQKEGPLVVVCSFISDLLSIEPINKLLPFLPSLCLDVIVSIIQNLESKSEENISTCFFRVLQKYITLPGGTLKDNVSQIINKIPTTFLRITILSEEEKNKYKADVDKKITEYIDKPFEIVDSISKRVKDKEEYPFKSAFIEYFGEFDDKNIEKHQANGETVDKVLQFFKTTIDSKFTTGEDIDDFFYNTILQLVTDNFDIIFSPEETAQIKQLSKIIYLQDIYPISIIYGMNVMNIFPPKMATFIKSLCQLFTNKFTIEGAFIPTPSSPKKSSWGFGGSGKQTRKNETYITKNETLKHIKYIRRETLKHINHNKNPKTFKKGTRKVTV
jgi:hypothetical protein